MSPRQVRTLTTGAVASVALAVTGTAVFSAHTEPRQIERSAASEPATTVAPDTGATAGQRGQSVSSGLRDKALRTAVLTDIPPSALAAYQRAASSISGADPGCKLPWTVLAAVGQVESDHGRSTSRNAKGIVGVPLDGQGVKAVADTDNGTLDGDPAHDRAVGPMQILPSTWKAVAVDGDGDGKRDPQDIDDAALGAAVYLCGSGADLSTQAGQASALRSYNNSASYVTLVMSVARSYAKDQKATFSLADLQTGGVDLRSVGTSYATDTTPATKKKTTTKKKSGTTTGTKTGTTTKTPAKTPSTSPTPVTTPGGGATTPGGGTTTPGGGSTPTPTPTPWRTRVPSVVGDQITAALAKLEAAGFTSTRTDVYDPAPAGQVLAQDKTGPAAKGASVALTVSAGAVPVDTVGQTYAAAKAALEAAGFVVGPVSADGVPATDDAVVTAQSPDADSTRVAKDATVTLTLAAAPTPSPAG